METASADDLWAKFRRMVGEFNITHEQIATLKGCIEGTETPTNAARKLTARVEESSTPSEMQQRLGGLWTILNQTAVALPSAQPAIIAIFTTIRTFGRVEEPTGEGDGCMDMKDGYIWRELANWGSDWADEYNHHGAEYKIAPLHTPITDEERQRRSIAWVNANAFAARLASTGDEVLTLDGNALTMAGYTIVDALELDFGEEEPDDLQAAAELFTHAAPELYCRSTEQYTGRDGRHSSLPNKAESTGLPDRNLWHGPEGYSLRRWEFWRARWTILTDVKGFPHEAQIAARRALEAMGEAEC